MSHNLEANKQKARARLMSWARGETMKKGYNNWGDKLIKDMITLGATPIQIAKITEFNTKKQKQRPGIGNVKCHLGKRVSSTRRFGLSVKIFEEGRRTIQEEHR